jgi:hypothetical protein
VRVRRLKLSLAVWGVWTLSITTLWVVHEWDVNGPFERFGHEGHAGQWNPTLWALGIGVPTLIVGIMALAVYFVRPTADHAVLRMQRLKFHVAAWLFGMVVLTPLWALIEWQDNGGFERWSNNSRPGDWQEGSRMTVTSVRLFDWALAAVFLVETLAAFTWSRGEPEWWLYGAVSLVIAALALIVAGSGGAWPRVRRPHRTLPSH